MTGGSMTTDELDRLEALAAEATPGRWTVLTDSDLGYDGTRRVAAFITACDPDTIRRLIAAAREPLDAAWREAEALAGSGLTLEYVVYPVVVEVGEPRIDPYRVKSGDHYAWGPTPAAALRALAEALRKPVPA